MIIKSSTQVLKYCLWPRHRCRIYIYKSKKTYASKDWIVLDLIMKQKFLSVIVKRKKNGMKNVGNK